MLNLGARNNGAFDTALQCIYSLLPGMVFYATGVQNIFLLWTDMIK